MWNHSEAQRPHTEFKSRYVQHAGLYPGDQYLGSHRLDRLDIGVSPTRIWSGARDLNPRPHGPEPAVCRVLQCPAGSSSVLLYSISQAVVSSGVLPFPPGSANA